MTLEIFLASSIGSAASTWTAMAWFPFTRWSTFTRKLSRSWRHATWRRWTSPTLFAICSTRWRPPILILWRVRTWSAADWRIASSTRLSTTSSTWIRSRRKASVRRWRCVVCFVDFRSTYRKWIIGVVIVMMKQSSLFFTLLQEFNFKICLCDLYFKPIETASNIFAIACYSWSSQFCLGTLVPGCAHQTVFVQFLFL